MANTVPFETIQTGDDQLDRIQANIAQAVRQLQVQILPQTTQQTATSMLLRTRTNVTVTAEAIGEVTISLPNAVPSQQTTLIRNGSHYNVHVQTQDASTVLPTIAPGGSMTVVADGKTWGQG